MTPGQRWTALIALLYVIAVVNFGAPTRTVLAQGPDPTAVVPRARALPPAPSPAATSDAPIAPYALIPPYAPPAGIDEPRVEDPTAVPVPTEAPRIVVAVRAPEQPGVPGRDDGAMAAAFLAAAGFQPTIVTIGPDPGTTCAELRTAGNVVVASEGLGLLNDCLLAAGVTVVAFDEGGDVPSSPGAGQVVSSRRGVEASLVDLARWGVADGSLQGKVGLVGARSFQAEIERAAVEMRRLGVQLAATAYLADAPASAEVGDAVRDFASKGIEVVVFATQVAQQRQWVAQHRLLATGVRFVVSDVADGVRDETYPAVFDGALAHTSVRIPWFARDNGDTPVQVACRARWETHAGGPMAPTEATRVFAWCENVELVDAALRASADGAPFTEALRRVALPSPLTSDLAGLADGGWGPTADAVLVWQATCGCWAEQQPFAPRA